MLPQQYCLRWKYHHSNLQTMFSQLLDRGCFCDVTLACEGQLIRAHRVVLCACSTFFDTVLTNYSNERDPIIIMKDVTFADVKCLIEFMYKGEINVEHSNLASLLKTADDLKIKGLAEVTWRDDEDSPPIPTPATEFFSPRQAAKAYYGPEPTNRQTPTPPLNEEANANHHAASPIPLKAFNHLPQLTPIALTTNENRGGHSTPPLEHYLGAKRKRGRPPLDDAYDVFNIRNMAHYSALEHQNFIEASRHFTDEHKHLHFERPVSPTTKAAVAAYHEHIHQHQEMLRHQQMNLQKQQQGGEKMEKENLNQDKGKENNSKDSEWISSKMELKVSESQKDETQYQSLNHEDKDCNMEQNVKDGEDRPLEAYKHKKRDRKKSFSSPPKEKIPKLQNKRKSLNEENPIDETIPKQEPEEKPSSPKEGEGFEENNTEEEVAVPKPVEEIENAHHGLGKNSPSTSKTTSTSNCPSPQKNIPAPPPPPPARQNSHFNKFAPEGYLVNEHGILMAPDFIHAPTVAIPKASTSNSTASSTNVGNPEHPDFIDVKMEDYDAADLRLTSEEISQWQDVIKMDDYLAKGRRPQFWEEPFTRRVLDAIKNKHLEMKKAARILGVSYGTLYGRYREVYGCLKHPYNGTSLRPNQLSLQSRLDFPLRAVAASLPTPIDIGKIRPKDLSELWARPQI